MQVSIPVGQWNVTHVGSIRGKAHPLPHRHTWQQLAHQWGDKNVTRGFDLQEPGWNVTCKGSIWREISLPTATTHTAGSEHSQWSDGTLHMGSIRGKDESTPRE